MSLKLEAGDRQIEVSKADKVFIDYLRNSYGQTTVAPYSARPLPGARVATPIRWDELSANEPRSWNLSNIFRRNGQTEDPWTDLSDAEGADPTRLGASLAELEEEGE